MNRKTLIEKVVAGTPVCVVEYRGTVTDVINWRDPASGRTVQIKKATHNVEAGTNPVAISEKLEDSVDVASYKPPFKKGDMCVWLIGSMSKTKGVARYTGKLELFTEN